MRHTISKTDKSKSHNDLPLFYVRRISLLLIIISKKEISYKNLQERYKKEQKET